MFAFFNANANIKMSGSSTVYPFAIIMAEEFAKKYSFKTPIVESVGTGGGFSAFCYGNDVNSPDIVNASREIKESEAQMCKQNGVEFSKLTIGLDAIVIAMHKNTQKQDSIPTLTEEEIFNAFARNVIIDGKVVPNPYKKWRQINPKLPNLEIVIYGPPSTSGTRDSFTEIALINYCKKQEIFQKHFGEKLRQNCSLIRNDGRFIESGENDAFIVHKISLKNGSIGIFGYSHYMENFFKIHAIKVNGIAPSNSSIAGGDYKISRPLFLYFKKHSIENQSEVRLFYKYSSSPEIKGRGGLLQQYHLVFAK